MSVKLIGREEELFRLERLYHSKKAELLALYGRRRVGKTCLIRACFSEKKETIFFNSTGIKEGTMLEQISNFTKEIGNAFFYQGGSIGTW